MTDGLLTRLLSGDRRALARALTLIETDNEEARTLVRSLYERTGRAHVVGVTGSPGVGKSTLVHELAQRLAHGGRSVGVLAVDPSSPFTGGALLGDRVRMDGAHPDVFIRSLATHGHVGGLSRTTGWAIRLMDAFGKDVVLVETVGAGQSEVDIMSLAHTVLVVLVPGLGDDVQANKAGILEIGDIFVVNKADRVGADLTARQLREMLTLGQKRVWQPPIVTTVAAEGQGVDDLVMAIDAHDSHLDASGERERRRMREGEREVRQALEDVLVERLIASAERSGEWHRLLERVAGRVEGPEAAALRLIAERGGIPWISR